MICVSIFYPISHTPCSAFKAVPDQIIYFHMDQQKGIIISGCSLGSFSTTFCIFAPRGQNISLTEKPTNCSFILYICIALWREDLFSQNESTAALSGASSRTSVTAVLPKLSHWCLLPLGKADTDQVRTVFFMLHSGFCPLYVTTFQYLRNDV